MLEFTPAFSLKTRTLPLKISTIIKLYPHWVGPFRVLKCIGPNLYVERYYAGFFFTSRLFATCCWMLFIGYRLGYACFGQVCWGISYLVLQNVLDYFDLLELFAAILWLAQANCLNQVTPGQAVFPDEVYFGWDVCFCSQIFCI